MKRRDKYFIIELENSRKVFFFLYNKQQLVIIKQTHFEGFYWKYNNVEFATYAMVIRHVS